VLEAGENGHVLPALADALAQTVAGLAAPGSGAASTQRWPDPRLAHEAWEPGGEAL